MLSNFVNPEENIKKLFVKEGSVVADFGAGSGHYVKPLSKAVGDGGKVYALDIQKDLILKLQKDLESDGFRNVETIWGDVEIPNGSKLRSGSLDTLVLSNILFQVEDKKGLISESYRVLKSGGKVLLVDWSESFGGLGPQPNYVIEEKTATEMFEKGGFIFKENILNGAHHYSIIFEKA